MKGESVHGALSPLRLVSGRLLLVLLLAGLLVGSACSGAGLGITFQGWGGPTAVGSSIYVPTKRDSDQASLRIFDATSGVVNNSFIVTGESTAIYGAPVQGPGWRGRPPSFRSYTRRMGKTTVGCMPLGRRVLTPQYGSSRSRA